MGRRRNRQRLRGGKPNLQPNGNGDVESTPAPLPPTAATTVDGAAAADDDDLDERRKRDDKLLETYRESLNKQEQDTAKEYDKAILTVAALAFGFSVSLVKDYIKPEGANLHADWLLYASWALFGLPVALILTNLQLSYSAAKQYRKITDIAAGGYTGSETFWSDLSTELKRVKRTRFVECFNWISLSSVIAGIITLALFAGLNTKGSNGKQQTTFESRSKEDSRHRNTGEAARPDQNQIHPTTAATEKVKAAAMSEPRVKPGQPDTQRTSTPNTPRVPLTTPQQRPPTQPSTQPKK